MKLTVYFHGLCLITHGNDPSHNGPYTVYLPDTRRPRTINDPAPPDQHAAALLEGPLNSPRLNLLTELDHQAITLVGIGGTSGSTTGSSSVVTIPHLNRFAHPLQRHNRIEERSIATVRLDLRGGLSTDDEHNGMNRRWEFDDTLRPGHTYTIENVAERVVWRATFPQGVEVRVTGLDEPFRFETNTVLHVANVCGVPEDIPMRLPRPTAAGETVRDRDFKWFYELLDTKPPAGGAVPGIKQRIGNRELPVPKAVWQLDPLHAGEPPFAPDTPTCLCGFYCECDPPHEPCPPGEDCP